MGREKSYNDLHIQDMRLIHDDLSGKVKDRYHEFEREY